MDKETAYIMDAEQTQLDLINEEVAEIINGFELIDEFKSQRNTIKKDSIPVPGIKPRVKNQRKK